MKRLGVLGHDDFTSPTRVHLVYFGTAPLRSGVRRPGPAQVTGSVFGSREKVWENRLGPTVRYDDMKPVPRQNISLGSG